MTFRVPVRLPSGKLIVTIPPELMRRALEALEASPDVVLLKEPSVRRMVLETLASYLIAPFVAATLPEPLDEELVKQRMTEGVGQLLKGSRVLN